ncbi:unnamed protein product [Lactuca saligna]|uniref:Uncharacterized protein n=1 Tax=Lactuca saligna TaxID=75948 RepID=A0AA35YH46_LACSI|nr:unnamed protein product [Lactuca saligna]
MSHLFIFNLFVFNLICNRHRHHRFSIHHWSTLLSLLHEMYALHFLVLYILVVDGRGKVVVISIDPCRQYLIREDEVGFKAIKLENLDPNEEEYAWYHCINAL